MDIEQTLNRLKMHWPHFNSTFNDIDAIIIPTEDINNAVEIIESLRQQLAKPAVEWMPIKDAPKDGTAILVMIFNSDLVYTVAWRDEAENSETKDGKGVGWRLTWDGYFFNEHEYPTHWMPLPAAYDALEEK